MKHFGPQFNWQLPARCCGNLPFNASLGLKISNCTQEIFQKSTVVFTLDIHAPLRMNPFHFGHWKWSQDLKNKVLDCHKGINSYEFGYTLTFYQRPSSGQNGHRVSQRADLNLVFLHAEVVGAAGHVGQWADKVVAALKRWIQQHCTHLLHFLQGQFFTHHSKFLNMNKLFLCCIHSLCWKTLLCSNLQFLSGTLPTGHEHRLQHRVKGSPKAPWDIGPRVAPPPPSYSQTFRCHESAHLREGGSISKEACSAFQGLLYVCCLIFRHPASGFSFFSDCEN